MFPEVDPEGIENRIYRLIPEVAAALAVCKTCTVLADCKAWVLKNPQEFGIWAGMTKWERDNPRRTYRSAQRAKQRATKAKLRVVTSTTPAPQATTIVHSGEQLALFEVVA